MNTFKYLPFLLLFLMLFSVNSSAIDSNFTLEDQNGNKISTSDLQDKIVVLEWINPDCPFVKRHYNEKTMVDLANKYKDKEVVWLAVNSTHYMGNENNKSWVDKYGLPYPILNDSSGEVGKSFGAKTTPHMYIIDKTNGVVYEGGIDDDKSGSNSRGERNNYVDLALTNLTEGDTIEISKSKPYGCSVKYK